MQRIADCFADYRDPRKVEHSVLEMVTQRVGGIALSNEELNDHDALRGDSLLALWAGKADLTGAQRPRQRDRGYALAGSSTLNRLELGKPEDAARDRNRRIAADADALDRVLVDLFLDAQIKASEELWLDVDATDDPLHGNQEGRFFHGYYKNYCCLPLYIFCGEHLLCARLRPSNRDASAGSVEDLTRIVGRIRQRCPRGALGGAGRFRVLSGTDHALVRVQRCGLCARSGAQRAPGEAHREGPAQIPQPLCDDGRAVASVPGTSLPDPNLLEPRAVSHCRFSSKMNPAIHRIVHIRSRNLSAVRLATRLGHTPWLNGETVGFWQPAFGDKGGDNGMVDEGLNPNWFYFLTRSP